MKIIVGLGNPTKQYEHTRHNAGFDVMDVLAARHGIDISEKKHKGLIGKGVIAGEKVILLKPQTYMNLSGESIRAALDYYKLDSATDLIVIYDDISLAPGRMRIRKKGSAGGHNGIKNIILNLGGDDTFLRLKVGVGEKPPRMDLVDHVLARFSKEDWAIMEDTFKKAADAVECMITEDADVAMNKFNA